MFTEVACETGKKRYLTFTHASHDAAAMRRKGRRGNRNESAFACRRCSGFHVGSTVGKPKNPRKDQP